jgi:hypothetical protein
VCGKYLGYVWVLCGEFGRVFLGFVWVVDEGGGVRVLGALGREWWGDGFVGCVVGEGVGVKGLLKNFINLWFQLVRWIFRWE